MNRYFQPLSTLHREIIHQNFMFKLKAIPHHHSQTPICAKFRFFLSQAEPFLSNLETGFPQNSVNETTHIENIALKVQNLLQDHSNTSDDQLFQALDNCGVSFNEDLVINLIRRHSSDWKLGFRFFSWISNGENPSGCLPGSGAVNEMLGVLGKMKRFVEVHQVFDKMSKRGVVNERSYGIVVHRYAAAHRINDAIGFFHKRKEYGFKIDLVAFQTLLMALCRYKHVKDAEFLFLSKKGEFQYDTKTWNIILNGWCVLGNLRETKRFWNEIIRSKCKPDKVTYGIFINSLCKTGNISTAVKVFWSMWEKGCTPDVVICNSVIDGLCFKKRIPEALDIFREMNEKDCEPDVVTYNCLIKHLCRIRRMDKVFELLGEMEVKGGTCSPNARTYAHLLSTTRKIEEVSRLVERMEKTGCKMTSDTYNMLLRLYMMWGCEEKVETTWNEMVKHGTGPDHRSFTVMIHGLYDQGRIEEALNYFNEMRSKGMQPEPRTGLLLETINVRLKERPAEDTSNNSSKHAHKNERKKLP